MAGRWRARGREVGRPLGRNEGPQFEGGGRCRVALGRRRGRIGVGELHGEHAAERS
jgi:hypothetical protein